MHGSDRSTVGRGGVFRRPERALPGERGRKGGEGVDGRGARSGVARPKSEGLATARPYKPVRVECATSWLRRPQTRSLESGAAERESEVCGHTEHLRPSTTFRPGYCLVASGHGGMGTAAAGWQADWVAEQGCHAPCSSVSTVADPNYRKGAGNKWGAGNMCSAWSELGARLHLPLNRSVPQLVVLRPRCSTALRRACKRHSASSNSSPSPATSRALHIQAPPHQSTRRSLPRLVAVEAYASYL